MDHLEILEKKVKLDDMEMSYLTCGNGPALILLHGALYTARLMWEDTIPLLTDSFKVYAIDRRGHGNSTNPGDIWSKEQFAKDLQSFIEKMNIERPCVWGYSAGGDIAIVHACLFPGVVSKYIAGGVGDNTEDVIKVAKDLFGFSESGVVDFDKFRSFVNGHVDVLQQAHAARGLNYWKTVVEGDAKVMTTPFSLSDMKLENISAEVLLYFGDRDEFVSMEKAVSLYRKINNSRLAIAQNSSHTEMKEEWVLNEVFKFLK